MGSERLGLWDAATSLEIPRRDFDALKRYANRTKSPEYTALVQWLDRYGYACEGAGGGGVFFVSLLSMLTFVNHGCANKDTNVSTANIDGSVDPDQDDDEEWYHWEPVLQRHQREHCVESRATRDIKRGEVLLEDYNSFDWKDRSMGKQGLTESWC